MASSSKFAWSVYPGATGYNVYRAPESDPSAFVLSESNIPLSILDIDCEYVKVTALTPDGETSLDCTPIHFCYVPPLECVHYTLNNYQMTTMDVVWDAYPNATGYNVYLAENATPDDFVLSYSNIAQTPIPITCQFAIVTAITPQGETPQCDPVHFCAAIETPSPTAYWKLDEASGDRSDAMGDIFDDLSTVGQDPNSTSGIIIDGLPMFNGNPLANVHFVSDVGDVHRDRLPFDITGPGSTWLFWMKWNSDDAGTDNIQIRHILNDLTCLINVYNYQIQAEFQGLNDTSTITDAQAFVADQWYFVTVQFRTDDFKVRYSIDAGSWNIASTTADVAGADTSYNYLDVNAGGQPSCAIDEMGIWCNTILSDDQINNIYNAGTGRTFP